MKSPVSLVRVQPGPLWGSGSSVGRAGKVVSANPCLPLSLLCPVEKICKSGSKPRAEALRGIPYEYTLQRGKSGDGGKRVVSRLWFDSTPGSFHGGRSLMVKALGCDPRYGGFNSPRSPFVLVRFGE